MSELGLELYTVKQHKETCIFYPFSILDKDIKTCILLPRLLELRHVRAWSCTSLVYPYICAIPGATVCLSLTIDVEPIFDTL